MPVCSVAPSICPVSKSRLFELFADSPELRENLVHKLLREHLAGVGFQYPDYAWKCIVIDLLNGYPLLPQNLRLEFDFLRAGNREEPLRLFQRQECSPVSPSRALELFERRLALKEFRAFRRSSGKSKSSASASFSRVYSVGLNCPLSTWRTPVRLKPAIVASRSSESPFFLRSSRSA